MRVKIIDQVHCPICPCWRTPENSPCTSS